MSRTKIQQVPLGDRHVSASVRRTLTQMLAPRTLQKGEGEFGIGAEHTKAELRAGLTLQLGAYPWYNLKSE